MNILGQVFSYGHTLSFFLDKYLEAELLVQVHTVNVYLFNFVKKLPNSFSNWIAAFLQFHQPSVRVVPHLCQHLVLLVFLILFFLGGV